MKKNTKFYNSLALFLYQRKKSVFVVTAALTLFLGWQASNVKTINTLENMLPQSDPNLTRYQALGREFGGDFYLMISIEAPDIFNSQLLTTIDQITQRAEKLPMVEEILSLTNVKQLKGTDQGINISPLVAHLPLSAEELRILKKEVLSDPLYTQNLIHSTEPITNIFIKLKQQEDGAKQQEERDLFMPQIKAWLESFKKSVPFEYHLVGHVPLQYAVDQSARKYQAITSVIIMVIISLILFYLFRTWGAIAACLGMIALSSVWTMGLVGISGHSLNFVTSLLPPLILIIAVLDCIHVYATYDSQPGDLTPHEKISRTYQHVLLPSLFSGLTNVIGFGSLMLTDMEAVRNFGFFAALGVVCALFLAMIPLPLVLTLLPAKQSETNDHIPALLKNMILFFEYLAEHHWKKGLIFCAALALVFASAIPRIKIETRPVDFFPRHSTIPSDFYFVDQKFKGSTTSDLIIQGPPGAFAQPHFLKQLEDFYPAIATVDGLSQPISILDYLKKANQAIHHNNQRYYAIPQTAEEIEQIYFVLGGDPDFKKLINSDYSKIRVHQRNQAIGSRNGKRVIAEANKVVAQIFKPPLVSYTTGANVVWVNMENYVVNSMLKSLPFTIVLVTLVMNFLLRSFKWGFISMIPNLFPILASFGIMGLFGIPLNMITMMIADMVTGLVVDDTMYIMTSVREGISEGTKPYDGLKKAFHHAGPALLTTSIVLTLGFAAICFTDFIPNRHFGFITSMTIIFGVIGDFVLLPAILQAYGRFQNKKHIKILSN